MNTLDTMLVSAIGALVAAIVFLYFDNRSLAKHFAKAVKEKDEGQADLIKTLSASHQKQEDELALRNEKSIREVNEDHRRELGGLVDRVLESSKNDKEHDREERARVLALAESLERRLPSRGGRGG